MQVTKIEDSIVNKYEVIHTQQDLENEYDAYISLKVVNRMFENGLISSDEKHKIVQSIIERFTPYLSEIVSQMT